MRSLVKTQIGGAPLTLLRSGEQRPHCAPDALHRIEGEAQSEQVAIKAQRTIHIADANCYVGYSTHLTTSFFNSKQQQKLRKTRTLNLIAGPLLAARGHRFAACDV